MSTILLYVFKEIILYLLISINVFWRTHISDSRPISLLCSGLLHETFFTGTTFRNLIKYNNIPHCVMYLDFIQYANPSCLYIYAAIRTQVNNTETLFLNYLRLLMTILFWNIYCSSFWLRIKMYNANRAYLALKLKILTFNKFIIN